MAADRHPGNRPVGHLIALVPALRGVLAGERSSVLGLPPAWYKSLEYRARVVREPRVVLAGMGCDVSDAVEIRVWDSSAETRYLVLPQRPPETGNLNADELAALVRRDHMIGVAR